MAAMGGAPGPEDLLAQIRAMLDEYLAMGPDTPVAAEAMQLATAIDSTAGGAEAGMGADMGAAMGAEPDIMTEASLPVDEGPVDNTALREGESGYSGTDMGEARQGAKDFLLNRKRTKA